MRSISRLLSAARELWPYYLGIALASVAVAGTTLLTPFIIKWATDEVVAQTQGQGRGVGFLVWLAVGLLAVELANTLLTNVGGYLGDVMTVRLRAILSSRYYARLLSLPSATSTASSPAPSSTGCNDRSPRPRSSCRRSATGSCR